MSGVVVEVRVKEGQDVMKGDVLCVQSAMKVSRHPPALIGRLLTCNHAIRWRALYLLPCPDTSSACWSRKATVSTRVTWLSNSQTRRPMTPSPSHSCYPPRSVPEVSRVPFMLSFPRFPSERTCCTSISFEAYCNDTGSTISAAAAAGPSIGVATHVCS